MPGGLLLRGRVPPSRGERKAEACARREATPDLRVAPVKAMDIRSKRASAASVSADVEHGHLAWAGPLSEALERRLRAAAETLPSPAPQGEGEATARFRQGGDVRP